MRQWTCWALLLLPACAGCGDPGPDIGRVTGTLTFDGKPLALVVVSFIPTSGGPAAADASDQDGEYELVCLGDQKGALVGEHRVVFTKIDFDAHFNPPANAPQNPGGNPTSADESDNETSALLRGGETGLVVRVKPGVNVIHFKLSSDKAPRVEYGH